MTASFEKLFPHLQRPDAPPEFSRPDPARATKHRQKVHVITLESTAAEAGSTVDNAVFNLKQAPWLLATNLDLAPDYWELRAVNFSFLAQGGATTPIIVEVRLDGGQSQMASYHTGMDGPSDVVAVVNGTPGDLQNTDVSSWPVSMTKPLGNRVRVQFRQVGAGVATGVPAWSGVTSPYWTLTLVVQAA